jgi:hypothetical protein
MLLTVNDDNRKARAFFERHVFVPPPCQLRQRVCSGLMHAHQRRVDGGVLA